MLLWGRKKSCKWQKIYHTCKSSEITTIPWALCSASEKLEYSCELKPKICIWNKNTECTECVLSFSPAASIITLLLCRSSNFPPLSVSLPPVILFYRRLLRCFGRFFAPTVHTSSKYYDYFSPDSIFDFIFDDRFLSVRVKIKCRSRTIFTSARLIG